MTAPFTLEAQTTEAKVWVFQEGFNTFEEARAVFKRIRKNTHIFNPFLPIRIVEEKPEGAFQPRVRLSTVATGSVLGTRRMPGLTLA